MRNLYRDMYRYRRTRRDIKAYIYIYMYMYSFVYLWSEVCVYIGKSKHVVWFYRRLCKDVEEQKGFTA